MMPEPIVAYINGNPYTQAMLERREQNLKGLSQKLEATPNADWQQHYERQIGYEVILVRPERPSRRT